MTQRSLWVSIVQHFWFWLLAMTNHLVFGCNSGQTKQEENSPVVGRLQVRIPTIPHPQICVGGVCTLSPVNHSDISQSWVSVSSCLWKTACFPLSVLRCPASAAVQKILCFLLCILLLASKAAFYRCRCVLESHIMHWCVQSHMSRCVCVCVLLCIFI